MNYEKATGWLLAMFEGEGWVGLRAGGGSCKSCPVSHKRIYVALVVTQKDPFVLRQFQELAGRGKVYGPHITHRTHISREGVITHRESTIYRYRITGRATLPLIRRLLPDMGPVKRAQLKRTLLAVKLQHESPY